MKTSITANLVHSIYAECLMHMLSLLNVKKGESSKVFTVHDCFMFSPSLKKTIKRNYTLVLRDLSLENRIEKLYK